MRRLVLGNIDYRRHMTDEGDQLQSGLVAAGWQIAGFGFPVDSVNVSEILSRVEPDIVFVQDVRDWDAGGDGCFDKRVNFENIEVLADYPGVKFTVVKDAGSLVGYQKSFAERIQADALIHYYHEESVIRRSRWMREYPLIRIYHSVNGDLCRLFLWNQDRKRGLVSGAVSSVYPLREKVFEASDFLGIEALGHPGYGNQGCYTPEYLRTLSHYKTHVCTASRFHFALRKIIESVAMGCTPITNLPGYDCLPEIDECLVRVSDGISMGELKEVIDTATAAWELDRARHFSEKAIQFYDYRAAGQRLNSFWSKLAAA